MSILDKYKANSAGSIEEYATQHKKYENEIDSLSSDKAGKEAAYNSSKSELEGMTRDDDPAAFDKKEAETETAKGSFEEAETALTDKQSEFDEYKEANPTYSSLIEKQSEIEEAKEGIQTVEEENTSETTPEEIGQKVDVQEAGEATQSEVGEDNVNVSGQDYYNDNTDYSPTNEKISAALENAKAKDPSLNESISNTKSQIQEQDNDPEL